MGAVEEMMCVVCVSVQRGHSGDECDLTSTLCKYDVRKGDLFVMSWVNWEELVECVRCEMCMGLALGGVVNRAPIAGGGRVRHNLHSSL